MERQTDRQKDKHSNTTLMSQGFEVTAWLWTSIWILPADGWTDGRMEGRTKQQSNTTLASHGSVLAAQLITPIWTLMYGQTNQPIWQRTAYNVVAKLELLFELTTNKRMGRDQPTDQPTDMAIRRLRHKALKWRPSWELPFGDAPRSSVGRESVIPTAWWKRWLLHDRTSRCQSPSKSLAHSVRRNERGMWRSRGRTRPTVL